MSEFNACWTVLFFVFDVPYLKIFGMFSMIVSIDFFQLQDLLLLSEDLLNYQSAFFQFVTCVVFFIYIFYSSCPVLCWCISFLFVFLLLLGPTVLVLDTNMFPGNCFLLFLLYLGAKDVYLGRSTATGTGRQRSTIFSLIIFFFFYHRKFLLI